MEIHRIGVKVFAADPDSVRVKDFIPIFNAWIQKQNLAGHTLIDLHDYSHLHHGPGILLVAHEGNFSIDLAGGRPGLLYYRKTPTGVAPIDHLAAIIRSGLQACRLLETEAQIRFSMNEIVVLANDRLKAPNTDQTFQELQPALSAALRQTFEDAEFHLARTSMDPKERLTITCTRKVSAL